MTNSPRKIVWLTDIHLNFVAPEVTEEFVASVRDMQPGAILLGGDIGEADSVAGFLSAMAEAWDCPIYFVLGNHDFYRGSIAEVRELATNLATSLDHLVYLTAEDDVFALTDSVGLIGHDGWADARVGDYMRSTVMMNDYRLIEELKNHDKTSRLDELRRLGDHAGEAISRRLLSAVEKYDELYLLTHLPPFLEACWHDGKISDEEWSPHFTCMAIGHAIRDVMRTRPEKKLTVFCGHTHGEGTCQPLPNVLVETGGADYGTPATTRSWEI